jgi:4-amino-4-deoxy-L-arabinose transferase-like glycosyltransferase
LEADRAAQRTPGLAPGLANGAELPHPGFHWAWLLLPLIASAASHEWWAPDEPRYAQVAREAWQTSSPIVLHVCGKLYLNKPPLLYWLAGLCGWLSGWSELGMRAPSLIATAATAWLTARLARRWWGETEARWAPHLYLTTAMTLWYGARLQIDPLLGVLTTAALVVLAESPTDPNLRRERNLRVIAAGALTGLAALAKGPVALALVGLVLGSWRILLGRSRVRASRTAAAASALLTALPALLWALSVVALQPPGERAAAARSLFFGQHLQRALEGTDHVNPPWYFLEILPLMFLPWTLPALGGVAWAWRSWRGRRTGAAIDEGLVRAASWLTVLFVFFSLSTGKRDLYFVPAVPAVALLAARWSSLAWKRARSGARTSRWIAVPCPALLLSVGVGACGLFALQDRLPPEAPPALWRGIAAGLPLIVGGALALRAAACGDLATWARAQVLALSATTAVVACVFFPAIDPFKSAHPLARVVAARPEHPSAIPCHGVWPEGFAFYSDRPFVHGPLGSWPEREGKAFLGLIRDDEWEILPAETRAKLRILHTHAVGSGRIHLVGAADG